ncbi:MAG: SH3 domain-containing protein, partial [Chloroflexota bacterium]
MRRAAFALTVLSALSALAGAWAASPAGDQPDRTWQEPASTWHAAVTAAVAVSETSGLSAEPATETQEAPGVAGVAAEPSPKPFVAHPYPSPADLGGREWSYFRETGHYVSGGFKRYFDAHGGVDGLGYPITEELSEDGWTVQYFQRARLEYHPDAPDAPVQRSLLGDMLLALRQDVRIEATFRPLEIVPDGARVFPETGYAVASPALEFFTTNGGLAAFGYPVSRAEGGAQWFQRARLEWVDGVVQAAPIGEEYVEAAGLVAARTRAQPPHLGRVDVRSSQVRLAVHRAPGSAEVVTRLPRDAQVQVTGEHVGPDGDSWYAVRLWNTLDGFVERRGLAFTPAPLKAPGAAGAPWKPEPPPAQGPFPLSAQGRARIAREFAGAPDGPGIGSLAAGVPVRVMSWATDAQGRAWYQFGTGQPGQEGASGWILAGTITLDAPDPLTAVVGGKPVAQTVAGKGMWFTYDVLRETPAAHLVATAQANGFSFLAPQVGTSRRGYWARGELDALLPAAHAAGLKVIP